MAMPQLKQNYSTIAQQTLNMMMDPDLDLKRWQKMVLIMDSHLTKSKMNCIE